MIDEFLIVTAILAGSVLASLLLARMFRSFPTLPPDSLGGTPHPPSRAGRARPQLPAGTTALPGASTPDFDSQDLPPLTTASGGVASPVTTRDDGVVAGDAFHFPTPHVGDGPS